MLPSEPLSPTALAKLAAGDGGDIEEVNRYLCAAPPPHRRFRRARDLFIYKGLSPVYTSPSQI